MEPKQHNFIVARFGDNDFGNTIKEALEEGAKNWGLDKQACPIIWKRFIIAYLLGYELKKQAICDKDSDEARDEEHFQFLRTRYFQNVRVTFEVNKPVDDDDGGSACYDLNLKYGWTF
jgi:hypothetical protein